MTQARPAVFSAALLLTAGPALLGHVFETYSGQPLHRTSSIVFLVDPAVAPGLRNSAGEPILTPESDPIAALRAAMQTWNSVPKTAVNLSLTVTQASGFGRDFVNTISFADTPAARSVVGSAIAVTWLTYLSDGLIVDSDIVFNPALRFATTPTAGCFDLQSVATHELGHALGAGHSISSATMFAYSAPEETWQRHLSSDDISFLNHAFPNDRATGGIRGSLVLPTGTKYGALVLAINSATGFVVGTPASGPFYSAGGLPPGDYIVVAMPLPFYLTGDASGLDPPDFPASFPGGAPRLVSVGAGQSAQADITIPNGTAN